MRVQKCAETAFAIIDCDCDPQQDMIQRQIEFQKRVGTWDDSIKDYGPNPKCDPRKVVWMLDLALQEASEAWDLVEGGWKGHKLNPDPMDDSEVLMELVDVAHYVWNAYAFAGGQPHPDLVAAAVCACRQNLQLPTLNMFLAWQKGTMLWSGGNSEDMEFKYGYHEWAHGTDAEKAVASRINCLRAQIAGVAETYRSSMVGFRDRLDKYPVAPGFVFDEIVPHMYAAAAAIPGCDEQTFYSAFVHKNDINHGRQDDGY